MYKQGFVLIGTAAFLHIITQIFQIIQDQTLDIFRKEPHVFSIIIPIIIGMIGIVLIFKDKFGWFKNKDNRKQYDAKKLNETVFKKLMRVSYSSSIFLFTHEIGFIIPTNKEAFYNKESTEYYNWLNRHLGDPLHQNHVKIEEAIPNLKIGENYLKEAYPTIFKEWDNIKQIVTNYNKKYRDCTIDLAKQAEKKIVSEFLDFHHNEKYNDGKHTNFYYFENIGNFIIESIDMGINTNNIELKIEESPVSKNYWIIYAHKPNHNLMGSYDKNKFDSNKLELILCDVIKDSNNIAQYQKSRDIDLMKLGKQIDKFCDNLEKNVVNDIDAQIIS